MNTAKVILCNRENVWLFAKDRIIYLTSETEHKLVPNQTVSFEDEALTPICTTHIEFIGDTIQALLQLYELYSLSIDKIVSGKVDKNHAIIVGRLCISSKTRYGITSKGLQRYLFIPRNRSYPNYIVASKLKQTSIDVYCSIEIEKWEDSKNPYASLVEVIGNVTDPSIYEKVIVGSSNLLSRSRNKDHREETKKFKEQKTIVSNIDEDWTEIVTMSIDPEGCRDIDDCLSVKYRDSVIELAVHIAAPTRLFDKKSKTGLISFEQINSIYGDLKTYHLLPEIIGTNKASLLPNEEKYCLSVIFSNVSQPRIVRTKIRNNFALSYEEAENIIEYKDLYNGYVELFKDKPEDSHVLVEKLMIKANEFVAQYLVKHSKSNALLRKTVNNVGTWYLPYSEDGSNKHESLELDLYTHFTSPIRRYADQLVHRQIFDILDGKTPEKLENDEIVNLNLVKNKIKLIDSQLKWSLLASPDCYIQLKGKLLYQNDLYARVDIIEPKEMRISIPLISRKITDLVKIINNSESNSFSLEYNETTTLEISNEVDLQVNLYWTSSEGLDGFRFEWVNPPICEWLSCLDT